MSGSRLLAELRRAAAAGEPADFNLPRWGRLARPGPEIDADVVRQLALGPAAPTGIEIHNVTIAGDLDLRNARGPDGGAANILKLEGCAIRGSDPSRRPSIDACHSHLSRLSLKGCTVSGIHLSSAVVDGDVILERVVGADETEGCWVRARGIRVGGSVSAAKSHLRSPADPPPYWSDRSTRFAFDLGQANIGGSLHLGELEAVGGVSINGSTIGGNLRADGAHFEGVDHPNHAHDGTTLAGQASRIGGTLFLCASHTRSAFQGDGSLDLNHVEIGGGAVLTEAVLSGDSNLSFTTIAGGLWLERIASTASISLFGSVNRGSLVASGGDAGLPAIDMTDATTHGSVSVEKVSSLTAIDATFGRSLAVEDAGEIDLRGSHVSTDLTINGGLASARLSGVIVDGDLNMRGVRFDGTNPELNLTDARVGGCLKVKVIESADGSSPAMFSPPQLRAADLRVYPGWRLVEATFRPAADAPDRRCRIQAFLWRPSDKRIVPLDGESRRFHELNEELRTRVADSTVKEYLSLFCHYVWADEGAFRIAGEQPVTTESDSGGWTAKALVEYGSGRFEATFRVAPDGSVEMIDDEPTGLIDPPKIEYRPPYRYVDCPDSNGWPIDAPAGIKLKDVTGEDRSRIEVALRAQQPALNVDLSRADVRNLMDDGGEGWGRSARLVLSGLEYHSADDSPSTRLSSSPDEAALKSRTDWLDRQYERPEKPTPGEYMPQPYERLASLWRAEGRHSIATELTFRKLQRETAVTVGRTFEGRPGRVMPLIALASAVLLALVVLGRIPGEIFGSVIVVFALLSALLLLPKRRLRQLILEWPFAYGLKTQHAIVTFGLLWFLGGSLVWAGSDGASVWAGSGATAVERSKLAVMKVDASNVSSVASDPSTVIVRFERATGESEIGCFKQIDPFVYSLDVMVPLLDLRQEQRCTVSAAPDAWFWRLAKVSFAVAGWVLASAIILTASGVIRRHVER